MFEYIRSTAGKLKCISLVVELLALSLIIHAFFAATYYTFDCKNDRQELSSSRHLGSQLESLLIRHRRDLTLTDSELYGAYGKSPMAGNCKEDFQNNQDNCAYQIKVWDYWVEFAKERGGTEGDARILIGRQEPDPPTLCPSKYLVVAPMAAISITWTLGFLMLIVMMVVDQKGRMKRFIKIDLIGHMVKTVLLVFATVMLGAFVLWVFISNYPCSQARYDNAASYKGHLNDNEVGLPMFHTSDGTKISAEIFETCLQQKDAVYKILTLIFATIFAAVATVLFGQTTITLRNKSRAYPDEDSVRGTEEQDKLSDVSRLEPSSSQESFRSTSTNSTYSSVHST